MDDDALNMSVRKFLKKLGVTAQREIEAAARAKGGGAHKVTARVSCPEIGLDLTVDGEITSG